MRNYEGVLGGLVDGWIGCRGVEAGACILTQTHRPPLQPTHTGAQTTEAAAKFNGAELVITGKWAFDIIYEFVYQFQEACQYRASAVRPCLLFFGGGGGDKLRGLG